MAGSGEFKTQKQKGTHTSVPNFRLSFKCAGETEAVVKRREVYVWGDGERSAKKLKSSQLLFASAFSCLLTLGGEGREGRGKKIVVSTLWPKTVNAQTQYSFRCCDCLSHPH